MKRFFVLAAALMLSGCGDYSDGDRVGTIQKFSRKGLISKTWEGEMMLGGLKRHTSTSMDSGGNTHSSTNMVANIWEFTVEDPALVEKVKAMMDAGEQVRATYRQEYLGSPFRTETGVLGPYFLIAVEPTK